MRILELLVICCALLLVSAGPGNPLLGADPAAEPAAETDRFEFPQYGITLELPAGGSIEQPGDEGWDYGESTVCQWFHADNIVHSVLLMVEAYESPITAYEFEVLSWDYYHDLADYDENSRGVAEPQLIEYHGRPWYLSDVDVMDEDGDYCRVRTLSTYERNRLYTMPCYYYEMNIDYEYGELSAAERDRIADAETMQILAGITITAAPAPGDYELAPYEVPRHGLALKLPVSGRIVAGDDPDLAGADIGPMEPSFVWSQPSAPAHAIAWFVFAHHGVYSDEDFAQFGRSLLQGIVGAAETGRIEQSRLTINGREWTRGETGYSNLENTEENVLIYLCQTPGGIQMVTAYTNRGYEQPAAELVELILATAEFSEFTLDIPESELFEIEDLGFSIELPGGGIPGYPGDDTWDYAADSGAEFDWHSLDGPLLVAILVKADIGVEPTAADIDELRAEIVNRIIKNKGATHSETRPDATHAGFTWMVYEFDFFEGDETISETLYVASVDSLIYCLGFGYRKTDREAALVQVDAALESLSLE
ncbi:hypothetical protein JW859_09960 [bacterium]|nr:hypothetical protein [bacterium]